MEDDIREWTLEGQVSGERVVLGYSEYNRTGRREETRDVWGTGNLDTAGRRGFL